MKTYTVEVTAEDIKKGIAAASRCCPVALAVHRATGDADWRVSRDYIWKGKGEHEISLPHRPVEFIRAFDNGRAVKPFTFSLSIP